MKKPNSKVDELREVLKAKKGAEEKKNIDSKGVVPAQSAKKEAEDLTAAIQAAEEEAKQHYDKLLRVMAEFENFKKRMAREQEEKTKFSNERIIMEILPVLDDLGRVLEHIPEKPSQEVAAIADGVELVRKTLYNTLSKFGLTEIPALGEPFDPAIHEALACIESDVHEENYVMAVHRKGYRLHDRVLRAAQVSVAKKRSA